VFGYGESSISKSRWPMPLLDLPRGVDSTDVKLYFDMDIMNIETTLGIDLPTVEESLQFSFKRFNGQQRRKKSSQGAHINFI
jgi:dTDP-4-dehydrorhamnose reductase